MFFDQVPEGLPDPVFGMLAAFEADNRPHKINLMIGVFQNEALCNELLPVVRLAKEQILTTDQLANYWPIDGSPDLGGSLGALLFGAKKWTEHSGHIYAAQAIGGTGALRVGAEFLAQEMGRKVFIPAPTWANHRLIFERAGFQVESLKYYNSEKHAFDRESYFAELQKLSPKSIVLFHASCHNPTGCDPSFEDWKQILEICKERSLVPFFDCAYQGFGDGIEEDAKVVRLFLEKGHNFLVAYSCSKNFSLYCQRVGELFVVCGDSGSKMRVGSQIKRIIRSSYSNPPSHGANIVLRILNNETLQGEWRHQVDQMRHRILGARENFIQKLHQHNSNLDFRFIRYHKGMFSYLDLEQAQVQRLIDSYAIYTLASGRINVAGLNSTNMDLVAKSIIDVCIS